MQTIDFVELFITSPNSGTFEWRLGRFFRVRSEGLGRLGGLAATEGRAGHHLGHTGQSGVASRVGVVSREGQFEPARAVCL